MLHLLQMGPLKVLNSPFLDSKLLKTLTPGAVPLLLVEIPHLPTLRLRPQTPLACIPPLFNMSPLCHTSTHPRFQSSLAYFVSSPSAPSPSPHAPGCFSIILCFLLPPDSLRVLQWNAGCLRARNTELLHFISFYSLNLICNLNSFSSFRIPGFSALRSDWAHSRSDLVLLMPCTIVAASTFSSNKVLSFCALSTSSLFLLDTNSDYVRVNTSLNNLPRSHSFLVHSPTHASFYFLGRLFLLSFPHHLGICLSSLWSPPFPLHVSDLIFSISPRCGSRSP